MLVKREKLPMRKLSDEDIDEMEGLDDNDENAQDHHNVMSFTTKTTKGKAKGRTKPTTDINLWVTLGLPT